MGGTGLKCSTKGNNKVVCKITEYGGDNYRQTIEKECW